MNGEAKRQWSRKLFVAQLDPVLNSIVIPCAELRKLDFVPAKADPDP